MDYDDQPTSTSSNGDSYYNSSSSSSSSSNGYKLVISNLHSRVTEDDILELFSDIGPIKRARFLDKGVAEVVYVKLDHAKEAIYKYDRSELDGINLFTIIKVFPRLYYTIIKFFLFSCNYGGNYDGNYFKAEHTRYFHSRFLIYCSYN